MGRGRSDIEKELVRQLGLSSEEAELYLEAVSGTRVDEGVLADASRRAVANSLSSKGMLIRAVRGDQFIPVHPRLALSNLFRTYEEKLMRERREKRLSVDRLTLELLAIYEKSKDTNPRSVEVRTDE